MHLSIFFIFVLSNGDLFKMFSKKKKLQTICDAVGAVNLITVSLEGG